ncbi:MAG: repair protein RecN [Thermodesulfobacterium sp.]|nr:repair protein RecN [Thermodesulfobacterium sp.]
MLKELSIRNLVLIDEISLNFDKGFIVFTGETGAGKSLIIKAIRLLLGDRFSQDYLKPGAKEGEVEALIWGGDFLYQRLKDLGYQETDEVHILRVFSPKKQRVFINGEPASLTDLSYLIKDLILLTSQHEFYTLIDPEKQLELLDEFADSFSLLKAYREALARYKEISSQVLALEKKLEDLSVKKDFLLFQIKELEDLKPDPEEEEQLREEREKLKNLTFLKEQLDLTSKSLEETTSNLYQALSSLEKISSLDRVFKIYAEKTSGFYYEIKEILREIYTYSRGLPEDSSLLDQIETRLSQYEKLKKKYQRDTRGLQKLLEELKSELNLLEFGREDYEDLKKKQEIVLEEVLSLAKDLSLKRKEGALALTKLLKEELKELGMEKVEFLIEVNSKAPEGSNLGSYGLDEVRFLFSSNPGIPPKPLEKVASGGELSRIFLAIQSIIQTKQTPKTVIFDEVDVGIGGITAKKVGEKLKKLSENTQVVCITHLPQIAAMADHHFLVEKYSDLGETKAVVRPLEKEERLKEIARMLGQPENLELAQQFLRESS